MLRLLLLFTVVPTVELFLLLVVGNQLGPLATVALVLTTGAVGAWLAKREGLAVIQVLRRDLQQGVPPAIRVVEAVMVVIGGILLVTPGVLTDAFGLSLVFGPTRRVFAPPLLRWLKERFAVEAITAEASGMRPPRPQPRPSSISGPDQPFDHPTR